MVINIQKIRTPIHLRERKNWSPSQKQSCAVDELFFFSCCQQVIIESLSFSPNGKPSTLSTFVLKIIHKQRPVHPSCGLTAPLQHPFLAVMGPPDLTCLAAPQNRSPASSGESPKPHITPCSSEPQQGSRQVC